MMGMVMPAPVMLRSIIGHKQALSVMPAVAENVIILLALGRPFLLAQAVPFAVRMFDKQINDLRRGLHPVARGLEKETVVNIHQAIEAKTLIEPAHFAQQRARKDHEIALNCIHVWSGSLAKFA